MLATILQFIVQLILIGVSVTSAFLMQKKMSTAITDMNTQIQSQLKPIQKNQTEINTIKREIVSLEERINNLN